MASLKVEENDHSAHPLAPLSTREKGNFDGSEDDRIILTRIKSCDIVYVYNIILFAKEMYISVINNFFPTP